MPRLELPRDGWADLREPDEIPRKAARRFRKVLYDVAGTVGEIDPTLEPDEQARAVGSAILTQEGGMDAFEDMAEEMVLAVVSAWSYGEVDGETLDDLPDKVVDAIYDECQRRDYMTKLMPDFGSDPDPESPTKPSGD